jgi:hypothetical protein
MGNVMVALATRRAMLRRAWGPDPVTHAPFAPQWLARHSQARLLIQGAEMFERAAGFSVLKYLPSLQVG